MYIFIYTKLTKIVVGSVYRIAGVFHTGTSPNPTNPTSTMHLIQQETLYLIRVRKRVLNFADI